MTSRACSKCETHWASRYVGIPFRALGRDRSGLDCYGLVCLVFSEQWGVRLPDYIGRYGTDLQSSEVQNLFVMGMNSPFWTRLTRAPRDGDVVVLQIQGHAHHVGVMVDRWRMLHAREGATVTIERVTAPLWRNRVIGYYRHRELGRE